jgi:hypothetical protein
MKKIYKELEYSASAFLFREEVVETSLSMNEVMVSQLTVADE